ncbi:MAG TPA: hypothetical protein VER55_03570 [Ardenticatenaceae bacterium]|nr:hypothetical protein [Ardenticatenaceae bacterium]
MAKASYTPTASYEELKRVEGLIDQTRTVDDVRKLVARDGPKVGYKAFCYLLGGTMTPEAMKPDEACEAAAMLEQQGKAEEAIAIYKRVAAAHPDHPVAKSKLAG